MNRYVQADLKISNRMVIYQILSESEGAVFRPELTRRTGISGATILKIIDFFIANKICVVGKQSAKAAVGRKASSLLFNPDFAYSVSVLFEKQSVIIGMVNAKGQIKKADRYPYESFARCMDYDLVGMINRMTASGEMGERKCLGVGVGVPAVLDKDLREIVSAPVLRLSGGYDIGVQLDRLSEALALPVSVENDVNASALGVYTAQYKEKDKDLVYILADEGLGSGIIINGQIYQGASNSAGEIGQMVFDTDYETDESQMGWMEKKINLDKIREMFNGRDLSEPVPDSGKIVDYLSAYLSLCIANLVAVLDIDVIVIGGSPAEQLKEELIDAIQQKCLRLCGRRLNVTLGSANQSALMGLSEIVSAKALPSLLEKEYF